MESERYYLAARYSRREEICEYGQALREIGGVVECRWLLGTHQLHPGAGKIDVENHPEHGTSMEAAPFAADDVEDVADSDTIVFFSEPPDTGNRGGRHVEFGMAIALGKRLVVIGPRENVFHTLPQVERYDNWPLFITQEYKDKDD